MGCPKSTLIQQAADLEEGWLDRVSTLGITAGASAPEILVQELVDALSCQFNVSVEELNVINEDVTFSLPRALSA
jgi:4-hydroxy-3-methylbut-2-enyl diphosphate reductase